MAGTNSKAKADKATAQREANPVDSHDERRRSDHSVVDHPGTVEKQSLGTRRDMDSDEELIRSIDTPPGEPYNDPKARP